MAPDSKYSIIIRLARNIVLNNLITIKICLDDAIEKLQKEMSAVINGFKHSQHTSW